MQQIKGYGSSAELEPLRLDFNNFEDPMMMEGGFDDHLPNLQNDSVDTEEH